MTEGKVWGKTTSVFADAESFSVHYLEITAGGYSSDHSHRAKWNVFYVLEGEFAVFQRQSGGFEDLTILRAGESLTIRPDVVHRFHAKTDARVLEIYFARLSENDIDRKNVGGVRPFASALRQS